jgi:predicted RND superfamily exporter protein
MLLPLVFAAEPLETQVRNAFQTCELWVRTATELSLVEQLKKSLVSMLLLAFASILVFMGDILLSLFATTAVAAIMLCTIGWLLLDGWTFGLVEVIALHLLLGYSDYYVLHVTHSYKEAEAESRNERAARASFALESLWFHLRLLRCFAQHRFCGVSFSCSPTWLC